MTYRSKRSAKEKRIYLLKMLRDSEYVGKWVGARDVFNSFGKNVSYYNPIGIGMLLKSIFKSKRYPDNYSEYFIEVSMIDNYLERIERGNNGKSK